MKKVKPKAGVKLVKAVHPSRPKAKYFLVDPGPKVVKQLAKPFIIIKTCSKACTKVVSLLPRLTIPGKTGFGFPMVNVDGFRWINAYVICDPILSSANRGFSLELSFALDPFVPGVGTRSETSFHFNLDNWFDPENFNHRTVRSATSDLTSLGGLPKLGGVDLAHVLRVPVIGPFVRGSAFNEDTVTRTAEIRAYLST
jgi:hypothetical protein